MSDNTQKTNRRSWLTTICGGLLFPQAGRKSLGKQGKLEVICEWGCRTKGEKL